MEDDEDQRSPSRPVFRGIKDRCCVWKTACCSLKQPRSHLLGVGTIYAALTTGRPLGKASTSSTREVFDDGDLRSPLLAHTCFFVLPRFGLGCCRDREGRQSHGFHVRQRRLPMSTEKKINGRSGFLPPNRHSRNGTAAAHFEGVCNVPM